MATNFSGSQLLESLLDKHENLFKEELGTIQPYQATLQIKKDASPKFFKPRPVPFALKFYKPRPVPFALKDTIGQEQDRLEKQGVIKKVDTSEWAAPIMTVPKADGRI